MPANAVPLFRPSLHGLHFANRYPPGPTIRLGALDPRLVGIGDASAGLCGGMAFTVRDLWEHNVLPPPDTEPPANGTPRFMSIVRRQVQSLDWFRLPLDFWAHAALYPSQRTWWSRLLGRPSLGAHVRDTEWARIRAEIDAGRLAQVGLVRVVGTNPRALTQNHQVLGWAYREEPGLRVLSIYDPNWPDRDDVELRMDLAGSTAAFGQTTGEPLHGFFLAPYRPARPVAWLRPV
jgi:hypothetical protein